eukprot:1151243-Pelagomonas_calceolata.AAC.6
MSSFQVSLLNFESVDPQAKRGSTAHDVFGQIQDDVQIIVSSKIDVNTRGPPRAGSNPEGWLTVSYIENHEHDVSHSYRNNKCDVRQEGFLELRSISAWNDQFN